MRRRDLLRKLVATGGAGALAACLDLESDIEIPGGDPATRPDRQHAWNQFIEHDEDGNSLLPRHHTFLSLEYVGSNRSADRETLEAALTDLERAYETSNEGLLFTVGYSPGYLERAGFSLETVDLPPPEPLIEDENVALDESDAFLHLTSDYPTAVLGAEEGLFEGIMANDTEITAIDSIFEIEDRRTGFIGNGLPADRDSNLQGIPEGEVHDEAPTYMNFRSGLRENQATENRVTIDDGPFAGGTTMHVSHLWFMLDSWFEQSTTEQIEQLFSPALDEGDIGETGEKLTDHNRVESADIAELLSAATDHDVVGHAQKMSRFRDAGRPPILRRDVNSDDHGEAGMIFVSLQREFEEFRRLRVAMEGMEIEGKGDIGRRTNNGILQYFQTRTRGNFLLPPRELRSLPDN